MKRSFASLSILAASLSLLHASPVHAAEDSMTQIQSQMAKRANALESRSASREGGRIGAGSALNARALNPQPLPPVETGRRPAAAGQDKALTTGIIIVGGKNGVAR